MLKVLLGIIVALGLALFLSYLLIPQRIVFSKVVFFNATLGGVERAFNTVDERTKWWPQKDSSFGDYKGKQIHKFKDFQYEFPELSYSGSTIMIYHDNQKVSSTLLLVPLPKDSVGIKWKAEFPPTNNPFKKISGYINAVRMKQNMEQVLQSVKTYLAREENLYGLKITEEKVKDTILISRKWTSTTYPSTEMIYRMIGGLKEYIGDQKAVETNHPMLNVFEDKGLYKNMVAIPVNRELPETDSFLVKKMIPGKILTAEVRGGPVTSMATIKKIEQYIDDHKRNSPAIPFESLITNRMEEKDSAKWVTKVYYPVY